MNDFGFPDYNVPVIDKETGKMTVPWRGYFSKINSRLQELVAGPITSTDGAPALFDGTDGKKLKE